MINGYWANKKRLGLVLIVILITGCATDTRLYNWGKYEQTLFTVYHDPEYKEQAIQQYINFINQQQALNKQNINKKSANKQTIKQLAPGLCAEAGTFMLEQGDYKNALVFYKMEYELWPESRPMLGALIQNLEARL